jgi:quercetin dioxygenase-like cupin family protein
VQVLRGRVVLSAGDRSWEARTGDMIFVPDERHSLEAVEDSAILLTVAKLS